MSWCIAGIAPDSKHATEQSEGLEQERKQVRESLISAYEKNIATRLKAEVCSLEANNYNITKDACASRSSILSFLREKQSQEKSFSRLLVLVAWNIFTDELMQEIR